MKYLALAALLSLATASEVGDLTPGDAGTAEVVMQEQEEDESDSHHGPDQYHESSNYDADTGIYTMTK